MHFEKFSSQKNIITFGAESKTYFVLLQGKAAVWQPMPHSEARHVLGAFLKQISDLASQSMGFYRPFNSERLPLTEEEWRSQGTQSIEFRDYLTGHARAVFRELVSIYEDRVVHELEPVKMNKKESKAFWEENGDFLAPGADRFAFPAVAFEMDGRNFEFENGLFFQKSVFLQRGEGFGELNFKDGQNAPVNKVTVRTEQISEFIAISGVFFDRIVTKILSKRQNKIVEFLMRLHCFQALSKNSMVKFSNTFNKIKLKRNQKVYSAG
jgi:hypothetical protein